MDTATVPSNKPPSSANIAANTSASTGAPKPSAQHPVNVAPAIVPAKRKRVLRACDECRKKKVKCDGGNPCTHCSVYNYKCSYNQTSNKKSRSVITQNKIASYELFINSIFPGLDLSYLASIVETKSFDLFQILPRYITSQQANNKVDDISRQQSDSLPKDNSSQIVSLVNIQDFVDELNTSMKDHCTEIKKSINKKVLVPEMQIKLKSPPPIIPELKTQQQNNNINGSSSSPEDISAHNQQQQIPTQPMENHINSAHANNQVPPISINGDGASLDSVTNSIKISLPELKDALHLVHVACDSALLFKFYNRSNLIKIVQDFYRDENKNDIQLHNKKLALIYSFLSIGALLENNDNAYNYYNAAHSLIIKKLIDTMDVMHIQSLFCLIIFLQCTCNLSKCYSYLGIALRSAFKMGLHRKVENINPILQENRKRIFWSIYKFDVYMNTILGLPQIFDDQIDQDLPLDIEDNNITETSYIMTNNNNSTKKLTTVAVSNYHTKLVLILNHIVKEIYPINTDSYYDGSNSNFIVALISKVKLMENQLNEWLKNLPIELDPDNTNIPNRFYKPNRFLKLAYLHISLALYRPFIHLISYKYVQAPNINKDSIKYGMNCINIAIKIIELATELNDHQLLNGAYWFSIYPIFYSVACLVYYIHENSTPSDLSVNVIQIRKFAEMGKDILINLRNNSLAAAKTYQTLNIMFEQLNRRTKKFHTNHQKYFEDDVKQPYYDDLNDNNSNGQQQTHNNRPHPQRDHHGLNSYTGRFSPNQTNVRGVTDNKSTANNNGNVSNGSMLTPAAVSLSAIQESPMENVANSGAKTNTTASSVTTNTPTPPSIPNNNTSTGVAQDRPYHIDLNYGENYQPPVWPQTDDNDNSNMNNVAQPINMDMNISNSGNIPVPTVSMSTFDTPLSTPPITDGQVYHGSMIDKLDMNLFGRFLPPYMLQSKSNNFNFTQRMAKDEIGLNNVLNNDNFFTSVLSQDIPENTTKETGNNDNSGFIMGSESSVPQAALPVNADSSGTATAAQNTSNNEDNSGSNNFNSSVTADSSATLSLNTNRNKNGSKQSQLNGKTRRSSGKRNQRK